MLKYEKAIEIINNLTLDFLREIDPVLTCKLNADFEYLDNYVGWTLISREKTEQNYAKFLKKHFATNEINGKFDWFMFSLLHEVGHHFTIDDWTDTQQYWIDKIKDFIGIINYPIMNDICDMVYYNLPDEYRASEWAVQYILENTEKCEIYWNKVKKVIYTMEIEMGE